MVRSLASENMEISEVDDFMHRPKSRVPFHGTETSNMSGMMSVSPAPDKYWCSSQPITSDGSSGMYPSSQNQFNHRLTRYGHRHFDPSLQGTQSDLSSVKYCGDSMKLRNDMGSDEYDSSGKSQQAQVGNLKLELPLDEDDYLMPSPQHKQTTSTYLDLKNATEHVSNPNLFPPNYSELFQNNIDNPEYLMSNEPIPAQTVGLPDVSEFIVPPSPGTSEPPKEHYVLPKSSEEESDHECYNEFDRLRREMQPLQKDPSLV